MVKSFPTIGKNIANLTALFSFLNKNLKPNTIKYLQIILALTRT